MPARNGILSATDGTKRCWWCGTDPLYRRYHDTEWGFPVSDDRRLFEKICLEGFQSGLSWLTILRKRDNFRAAFADFDIATVAKFGQSDVTRLLTDAGIVRHRKKIESTVNNATRALELIDEFGSISAFVWRYAPPRTRAAVRRSIQSIPAKTPESIALSKNLKRRNWSFVGPTTAYAFMQSVGIVNDHLARCDVFARVESVRESSTPPQ